jgi:hypothetical protein
MWLTNAMQLWKLPSKAKHERLGRRKLGRGHIGNGPEIALTILSQASIVGAPNIMLATESSVRFERAGGERLTRQEQR